LTLEQRKTPQGRRKWKLHHMMLTEPRHQPEGLGRDPSAGAHHLFDRDMIRDEHSMEVYHSLTHGQWAVFPGSGHDVNSEDPERFNQTVRSFLEERVHGQDDLAAAGKILESPFHRFTCSGNST
jgi:hypothetical protein